MASTKLPRFLLCLVLFVSASLTVFLFFTPHFSTSQKSSPPPLACVMGDVHKEIAVKIESGVEMTVLRAIAQAGGVNADAALDEAKLLRANGWETERIPLPLKEMLDGKAPAMNLQDGDVILIPRKVVYYDLPLNHDAPAPLQELQDP